MNCSTSKKIKVILTGITLAFVFAFVYPNQPKEVQAQFGGVTFNIKLKDLAKKAEDFKKKYGKFGDIAFQQLKKRYLTQIQNDLVNWVQGNGKPRFITNPEEFLVKNAQLAAASAIDGFFLNQGVNICQPFKADLRFLVDKVTFLRQEQVRCTLDDIKDNLESFADKFENGGWTTWIKLHEARNTLPGTYLASTQIIGSNVSRAGNTAQAQITAGKGFLDIKTCLRSKVTAYKFILADGTIVDSNNSILQGDRWNLGKGILELLTEGLLHPDQIEDITTGQVRVTVGESPADYSPDGKPMEELDTTLIGDGKIETCVETTTITPGSVVGDWVAGGLKDLSLGPLMNAKEAGEIINAVIDAAVNRAAREGLSKLGSGPGSWSQPSKAGGQTYYGQAAVQPPVIGAESPASSALLNRVLAFQNNIQKLITQINSLIRGENTENTTHNFKKKLEGMNFLLRRHNDVDDIIDSNYSNHKLNEESRNPGPYIANKVLNEVIAGQWSSIIQTLQNIDSQLPDSCSPAITDIRLFEHPQKEALPFTDKEGVVFKETEVQNMYWYLLTSRLPGEEKAGAVQTTATAWKNEYLPIGLSRARSNENLYLNIASSYAGLIDNAKQLLINFQNDEPKDTDDSEFVNSILPIVSLYDSLLTDYDRAARETGAMGAVQNYVELRDQSKDEQQLKILRSTALESLRSARNRWLTNQQEVAEIPADEKAKAVRKAEIIADALAKVELSLRNLLASRPKELEFFDLRPADINNLSLDRVLVLIAQIPSLDFLQEVKSVGAATAEVIGLNISQIEADLSEREGKLNTHQSEITDVVGIFLSKEAEDEVDNVVEKRKELGVKGGESEWEKYFYNRFQLAYATYINDFYKNWFKCPLPKPSSPLPRPSS